VLLQVRGVTAFLPWRMMSIISIDFLKSTSSKQVREFGLTVDAQSLQTCHIGNDVRLSSQDKIALSSGEVLA
jgi:hypothetical protein